MVGVGRGAHPQQLVGSFESKSPSAVRATKEAVRSTRGMSQEQAMDYLNAKTESAQFRDREGGRNKALAQFIDEKSFKPGFGDFKRWGAPWPAAGSMSTPNSASSEPAAGQ